MGHIDLVNFSVPVKMFEPRSYLQKLADVWVYPRMLSQAADTSDPVERMKLVITWCAACCSIHYNFLQDFKQAQQHAHRTVLQACVAFVATCYQCYNDNDHDDMHVNATMLASHSQQQHEMSL